MGLFAAFFCLNCSQYIIRFVYCSFVDRFAVVAFLLPFLTIFVYLDLRRMPSYVDTRQFIIIIKNNGVNLYLNSHSCRHSLALTHINKRSHARINVTEWNRRTVSSFIDKQHHRQQQEIHVFCILYCKGNKDRYFAYELATQLFYFSCSLPLFHRWIISIPFS